MTWGTILMVVGILAFLESITALSFPKWTLKVAKKMGFGKIAKNQKRVKKVAWWEFVIAIIIFIIGVNI